MDKYSIINLKLKGYSNMKVSKILGLNKKTISKYWNEHLQKQNELNKSEYPNRDYTTRNNRST